MNTKLCLAVAAANKDLAHDVLLDLLTTNCAVLLRVKCFGIACKIFFQTLAECDAEIGGVVYLAHTAGNALTDGIIRDTGGAMQHQRNRNDLADLAQAVDVQLRGSLVNAVCSAVSNSQRIHTGALYELSSFGRNGVAIAIAAVQIIFLAADLAQLSFHRDAGCMAGTNNFLGDLDVFLENMVRTIDLTEV